jgi:hypothetical protein
VTATRGRLATSVTSAETQARIQPNYVSTVEAFARKLGAT